MCTPLTFDIKRASVSDGPGIRTVIFFKGCNMDCFWCHNPEGKKPYAELAYFREKCIACGECRTVCQKPYDGCTVCGRCTEVCPTGARKRYGEKRSVEELLAVIASDRPYYLATGGGVTFSGGECMLYPTFVQTLAEQCRNIGISVAVDTAGNVPVEHFRQVLPYTDLFLYDLKCLNPDLHRRGTGIDNVRILENLQYLREAGANLRIRTPMIPDFNEGEEIERIRQFCTERHLPLEILPYHAFGESKKEALRPYM